MIANAENAIRIDHRPTSTATTASSASALFQDIEERLQRLFLKYNSIKASARHGISDGTTPRSGGIKSESEHKENNGLIQRLHNPSLLKSPLTSQQVRSQSCWSNLSEDHSLTDAAIVRVDYEKKSALKIAVTGETEADSSCGRVAAHIRRREISRISFANPDRRFGELNLPGTSSTVGDPVRRAAEPDYREPTLQEMFLCRKRRFIERSKNRIDQISARKDIRPKLDNGQLITRPTLSKDAGGFSLRPGSYRATQLPKPMRNNEINLKIAREETARRVKRDEKPRKDPQTILGEKRRLRQRMQIYARITRDRNHYLYSEDSPRKDR